MKEDLFRYYEDELRFIREMAKEFADTHGGAARRLLLDEGTSSDPHVERLIQAFALIAGRIRHKLDDEFPEITEALLGVLYPHYIRPIPSMGIAQLQLDAQGKVSGGRKFPRKLALISKRVDASGERCRFQTAYPVTLWPLRIDSAHMISPNSLPGRIPDDVVSAIQLSVVCEGGSELSALGIDRLRFHLAGEGKIPFILYELLLNSTRRVLLTGTRSETTIDPFFFPEDCIHPVGFGRDEALLEYPDRSFIGYQLLTEYLIFAEKFLFFDLAGFDKLPLEQCGNRFELTFLLGDFERKDRLDDLKNLDALHFQLGCTPIVNLFERTAEPIDVAHTQTEYRVVPNQHSPLSHEVYSINEVKSKITDREEIRHYQPFYGFRYAYSGDKPKQFWYASRRSSGKLNQDGNPDHGTEVYLSLVDKDFRPSRGGKETLSIGLTCTNRDRPVDLQLSRAFGELIIEGAGIRARCVAGPTKSMRSKLRSNLQWRLISHLALNQLSIARTDAQALREILSLYNFEDNPGIGEQISSIVGVSSEPHMTRLETPAGIAFVPGLRVRVDLNENRIKRGDTFLMASVLERFFGLYCATNSFTQTSVFTQQRKEALHIWPPRTGERSIA